MNNIQNISDTNIKIPDTLHVLINIYKMYKT